MKNFLLFISIILCSVFSSRVEASSTVVLGADLTYTCLGSGQYQINLTVYGDCNSLSLIGPLSVDISSMQCGFSGSATMTQVGSAVDITPICALTQDACNGGTGYGIQKYTFQGIATLPTNCGTDWILIWTNCCRDNNISTLSHPNTENFYVEADLDNTQANCDNSPIFNMDPIGVYCVNSQQIFNHGATDTDGDSLVYYLMPALNATGSIVTYAVGYTTLNPISTNSGILVDSSTGQVTLTPNLSQVAVVKIGCDEYRNGVLIGHIERDMEMVIDNCNNAAPIAADINGSGSDTILLPPCSTTCFTIQTSDLNSADSVTYSWQSASLPGATISASPGKNPTITICWAPPQSDTGVHQFILQLQDNHCPYIGVSSKIYTVIVTPANDPPVVSTTDTTVCPGLNLQLTASSTGTVTNYRWSDGTNNDMGNIWVVNPTANTTYNVSAYYADGCVSTAMTSVAVYPAVTAGVSNVDVQCPGQCSGSALAQVSGGTAPYRYRWSNGINVAANGNLCPGAYVLTVTDTVGCVAIQNDTIHQLSTLSIAVTSTVHNVCFGLCAGQAVVAASGGSGSLAYAWSNSVSGYVNSNLCAGAYIATVTDGAGCTVSISDTIREPARLVADTIYVHPVSCHGGSDGAMALSVTGGTLPYAYIWPQISGKTDSFGQTFTAGQYAIYVSDGHSCKDTVNVIINEPPRIVATLSVDSISCFGANDGRVRIPTLGGTPPYTYDLDGLGIFQPMDSFQSLTPGSHFVVVFDANNCDTTIYFNVGEPPALILQILYTRNASCGGPCDGAIKLNGQGGFSPYTFNLNGGAYSVVDSFTSLCAATYTVSMKDAIGCILALSDSVAQPPPVVLTVVASNPPLCNGDSSGQIVVSGSGGSLPYAYSLNGGTPQSSGHFIDLVAGQYIVMVITPDGCFDTIHMDLVQPAVLNADTLLTQPVNCHGGSDGIITLSVTGGVYPYIYQWQQVPGKTDSTGSNFAANVYTIFVTDANGCHRTVSVILTDPPQLYSSVNLITPVTCYGGNDGGVVVSASGGTPAYTFDLDSAGSFGSSGIFGSLTGGRHTITVHDAHGCDTVLSFVVPQPPQAVASIVISNNVSCNGICDGLIVVSGSGGVLPFVFSIDGVNFTTSDSFTNLCAMPYLITIRDNNNCSSHTYDTITQPSALVITPLDSIAPHCPNGSDGSFAVIATGGMPQYMYSVDGGLYQSSDSFFNQSPGAHIITAKDSNSCPAIYTITVPNLPVTSSYDTVSVISDSCYGGTGGAITLSVTGSVTPYSFVWSNAAISQNISALPAGLYSVTVTDGNGCDVSGTGPYLIDQPSPIVPGNTVTGVHCFGDSNGCITVTISGGTPPYTSTWSNGTSGNINCLLPAGLFSDTIRDSYGCTVIDTNIQVIQPDTIHMWSQAIINEACNLSNGSIAVGDSGGTTPYQYVWSNGNTTNFNANLSKGLYSVTVIDANGCRDSATYRVDSLSSFTMVSSQRNVFCDPLKDGWISVIVSGGNPGYQYNWSNGANTPYISGLDTGHYRLIITDSRGCKEDTTFVIKNDSSFAIAALPDTATILEGDGIQLALSISGDQARSIVWSPAKSLSCSDCADPAATPLRSVEYSVHAISDSGCKSERKVNITVIPQHQLYLPDAFTPNNDGHNDYWEAFGHKNAWRYVEVSVYDRWGEKVFESKDINYQWDGSYLGAPLQPGVYMYTFSVVFLDDFNYTTKGSITLLR